MAENVSVACCVQTLSRMCQWCGLLLGRSTAASWWALHGAELLGEAEPSCSISTSCHQWNGISVTWAASLRPLIRQGLSFPFLSTFTWLELCDCAVVGGGKTRFNPLPQLWWMGEEKPDLIPYSSCDGFSINSFHSYADVSPLTLVSFFWIVLLEEDKQIYKLIHLEYFLSNTYKDYLHKFWKSLFLDFQINLNLYIYIYAYNFYISSYSL